MLRNQSKAMIALLPQTHRHSLVLVVVIINRHPGLAFEAYCICVHCKEELPSWKKLNYNCTRVGLLKLFSDRHFIRCCCFYFLCHWLFWALVPHCVMSLCFLCCPVKLVRLNNTTTTSSGCRGMTNVVCFWTVPLVVTLLAMAELCRFSWGM